MDEIWLLLVEDDPLFVTLLQRSWKKAYSSVPLLVARSLAEMAELLEGAARPPSLVIMDRTLPDGDGHKVASALGIPVHCWSATDDRGAGAKPTGKAALEGAVGRLAALAGLSVGPSRP